MKHRYALLIVGLIPLCASAISINGYATHPNCGQANGCITTSVTGGTPPYTYVWTPVPATGQGTPSVCGLLAGTWSLTVTDAIADEATEFFTLVDQGLNVFASFTYVYGNETAAHHPCTGQQEGSFRVMQDMLGGTPPYTVTADGQPPMFIDPVTNDPVFGYYFPFQSVTVNVVDANGCVGVDQMGIDGISTTPFSAVVIDAACGGQANGSAELTIGYSGPYGPNVTVTGPGGGVVFSGDLFWDLLPLTGLEAGIHTVQRVYNPIYMASVCEFTDQFTIPDLGPDCGTVNGRLFIDNNQDCVQSGGEVSVPFCVIEILPGPQYAITNSTGDYTRNLINGNFTLEAQGTGTNLYPICPAVQPVPFTVNSNTTTINLADSSLIPLDVKVIVFSNAARPGFAHTIWGEVRNMSGQLSGPVTLTANVDPQMGYTGAVPTPTSVAGNTLTWDLPAFGPFAHVNFSIQLLVPPDVGLIGLPFAHVATVSQTLPEGNLVNNANGINGVFQGAYDPNDKLAFTSTSQMPGIYVIDEDEWIDYTIRFQNTGTDTAFNVVVTDTVSAALDLSTYEQGVASHPFDVSFKSGRVVEWRFADILLPDSGTNEAASHGLVSFRIRPHLPLLPGTELANNADIFFDFNDPVRTNDAVVTAEFSTSIGEASANDGLMVYPNPASERLFIELPGAAWICLLDITGRVVLDARAVADRTVLGLVGLPAGVYVLRVTNAGGQAFTRPVTKH